MSDDSARRSPQPATDGLTEDLGTPGATDTGGPMLPRYQILGLVGIGGMGVVYRAEDTLLGRTVALKFLPPMLTPNSRAKARFLNEARAAAALDHPNICTLYEVGETAEGQIYLAMAFYEGDTLKRRLKRGPLPVVVALHTALQVARGLADAHKRGIVHRDIKPANLMIMAEGLAKILDFGIARLPNDALPGPLLGTPGYMAPEQARGGTVDARCDVWSLGVVLHEMLTGRPPSGGDRGTDLALEELCPGAPPGTADLLSRMLAEEPANRYPDAGALLADLTALKRAAAETDMTLSPDLGQRRFSAWTVVLVTALVLASGFGLVWGLLQFSQRGPDPRQGTFDRLTDIPGREWFPTLDPKGNFFFYAKKEGDRSRLFFQQVGGGKAQPLLPDSQEGDSQPALSPDGKQIAFRSEREGGGIFVMGWMGDSVRRVTDSGFNPAWSPDGKWILYATATVESPLVRRNQFSQIYRVNLATRERRLVQGGDAVQPSWSPNGLRIAYWGLTLSGKRVIWTVPVDGGKPVQVTDGKKVDWNPVWSPDGRYLYFSSDRSGVTNLWRVPIDEHSGSAGKLESVTNSAQPSMMPSLSQDGKRIAYATDETKTILQKVAFDPTSGTVSGSIATITPTAQLIQACDASRDGRGIVYQTSVPQENIVTIHPDGTDSRQLTSDEFKNRNPRWSPDGKRIAFSSNRGGKYEIWLLGVEDGRLERTAILPDRPRAFHPIWSPDGQQLACDFDENEALIDLTRPPAYRRPQFLPWTGPKLGFSASSWSADGRWLAGVLHTPEHQIPGVVLYSPIEKRYKRLTNRGDSPTWLSDSRRLLYRDGDKIVFLDTVPQESHPVLSIPSGSDYNDFCLSPDDRVLYLVQSTEEGDIWMLTMK